MFTIVSRYALYSLIALEVLLLPLALPNQLYAEIEYYKFLVFFFPFCLLGAHSGFIYFKFTEKQDRFSSLLLYGGLHFFIVATVAFIFTQELFLLIACVLMGLMLILEQKAQVNKHFILALSAKPLISSCLIVLSGLIYFEYLVVSGEAALLISVLVAFLLWLILLKLYLREIFARKQVGKISEYFELIKKGYPLNFATLILMAMFFIDRYVTKEYYPELLPSYSFSFNIIQFVILALTTIGYVNTVKVGEELDSINFKQVLLKLKYTYKIFVVLLGLFAIFVYGLSFFYELDGFVLLSMIMAVLIGNFFCINSVGIVALYKNFHLKTTYALTTVLIFNVIFSYIGVHYQLPQWVLILKTGVLLNCYSIAFLLMARRYCS